MSVLINPFIYGGGGGATDPNFSSVVLLCHFNGTITTTTTLDSSPVGRTVTIATGTINTSVSKFGAGSYQPETNGSATCADSDDWNFGSGQFTVEAWIRTTSTINSERAVAAQWFPGGSNASWVLRFNSSGNLQFSYSTDGFNSTSVTGTTSLSTNTWYHVAIDRDGSNNIRLYLDGIVVGGPTAAAATFFNSNRVLRLGNHGSSGATWIGQLDDMRITKGVARYGGAFTPPAAAFPDS
jgi:hypothetical protein